MTAEAKLLSEEQLHGSFAALERDVPTVIAGVRSHIAALTAQLEESNRWRHNYENAADHMADDLRQALDRLTAARQEAGRAISIEDARKALRSAFAADDSYAWSWHCNIACCAMDEGVERGAAQRIARRFMKLAFDSEYQEPVSQQLAAISAPGESDEELARFAHEQLEASRFPNDSQYRISWDRLPEPHRKWTLAMVSAVASRVRAASAAELAKRDARIAELERQVSSQQKEATDQVWWAVIRKDGDPGRIYAFEGEARNSARKSSPVWEVLPVVEKAFHDKELADLRAKLRESEHTSRDFCEKWQIEYQRTNERTRKLTAAEQELAQLRKRAEVAEREAKSLRTSVGTWQGQFDRICDAALIAIAKAGIATPEGGFQNQAFELKPCIERLAADRDRLAAELATAKEQLAEKTAEVERVRKACEPLRKFAQVYAQSAWEDDQKITVNGVSLTCGEARSFVAALTQHAPAPSPEPEAPKAEQPQPAFECPGCGCTKLFGRNNAFDEPLVCDSASCNWSGTWAEVAAAKGGEGTACTNCGGTGFIEDGDDCWECQAKGTKGKA